MPAPGWGGARPGGRLHTTAPAWCTGQAARFMLHSVLGRSHQQPPGLHATRGSVVCSCPAPLSGRPLHPWGGPAATRTAAPGLLGHRSSSPTKAPPPTEAPTPPEAPEGDRVSAHPSPGELRRPCLSRHNSRVYVVYGSCIQSIICVYSVTILFYPAV